MGPFREKRIGIRGLFGSPHFVFRKNRRRFHPVRLRRVFLFRCFFPAFRTRRKSAHVIPRMRRFGVSSHTGHNTRSQKKRTRSSFCFRKRMHRHGGRRLLDDVRGFVHGVPHRTREKRSRCVDIRFRLRTRRRNAGSNAVSEIRRTDRQRCRRSCLILFGRGQTDSCGGTARHGKGRKKTEKAEQENRR